MNAIYLYKNLINIFIGVVQLDYFILFLI